MLFTLNTGIPVRPRPGGGREGGKERERGREGERKREGERERRESGGKKSRRKSR